MEKMDNRTHMLLAMLCVLTGLSFIYVTGLSYLMAQFLCVIM